MTKEQIQEKLNAMPPLEREREITGMRVFRELVLAISNVDKDWQTLRDKVERLRKLGDCVEFLARVVPSAADPIWFEMINSPIEEALAHIRELYDADEAENIEAGLE